MSLLSQISDPADLRNLSQEQLVELSAEIRQFLLEAISKTGGHLSPNLGVVELTIALHRVFDSPHDRIIWDVGHQAYVHKLLTGRQDFSKLRSMGGLSGYPSRTESEHDFVENSHASTSLSYALGHALAHPDRWTVAVIGDGALTGGMAYEALNHIAVLRPSRLVVVVNDNGRSYAPTVGGVAALANLASVRFDPRYERAKQRVGRLLRSLPLVGDTADEMAGRLKDAVKQLVAPSTVFDILGLKYSGAINGHDIPVLEETLSRAKEYEEPVIVHVLTEKGQGYGPAVEDEVDRLHGIGSFDIATGKPFESELKLTDVAARAVASAAARRPEVVAISAAMVAPTGLQDTADAFPDRVFDTGIAEQHTVALAAGLAMAGRHPVVAIYSTFLQRAFDQVILDVAMHDLPVTFLIDRAGVTGPDGSSHHGAFDLAYLRMVPNMIIGAPADAAELAGMLESALDHPGPVAIRFPKAGAPAMPEIPAPPIPIGVWQPVSDGDDVLILAVGRMVETAQKVAAGLAADGIACRVVNARWVKPLDPRLAEWAASCRMVVTVEDGVVAGGFGSAVMEALAGSGTRVVALGLPDRFLPHGSAGDVLRQVGLDAESIEERVRTEVHDQHR
ncbi:MAG TPA: 1-deoxy-D-xylulose-5-phosphate synthase [Acidimicrobiia bacterium]